MWKLSGFPDSFGTTGALEADGSGAGVRGKKEAEAELPRHWAFLGRMKAITTRRFKVEGELELALCVWPDSHQFYAHGQGHV